MRLAFPWSHKKERKVAQEPPSNWLAHLAPGDLAIDCGANVGKITVQLAKTGATVYAFEPNPHAFEQLKTATAGFMNVTCLQKAVGAEAGLVKLYMHENAAKNPVYWSTGSSLLESKGNVNRDDFVEVECVDLCEFIRAQGRRVKLLKMDVEGVECAILKKMMETDLILEIDQLFCEMHDRKIESLREPSDEIRRMVRERKLDYVDLNWI